MQQRNQPGSVAHYSYNYEENQAPTCVQATLCGESSGAGSLRYWLKQVSLTKGTYVHCYTVVV